MKDIRKLCIKKMSETPQDIEKSNSMWDKRAYEFASMVKAKEEDGYVEKFTKFADIKSSSIIDIGAGPGRYTKRLIELGSICDAVEPSKNMALECEKYLSESNIDSAKYNIYNVAFQDFKSDKVYDYAFLSNSPAIGYYENYQKILSITKKGVFVGSWLYRKDFLFEKLLKKLDKKDQPISNDNFHFFYNLLASDGYLPQVELIKNTNEKKENLSSFVNRYTSFIYGSQYNDKNILEVKNALEEFTNNDGSYTIKSESVRGVIYASLNLKI